MHLTSVDGGTSVMYASSRNHTVQDGPASAAGQTHMARTATSLGSRRPNPIDTDDRSTRFGQRQLAVPSNINRYGKRHQTCARCDQRHLLRWHRTWSKSNIMTACINEKLLPSDKPSHSSHSLVIPWEYYVFERVNSPKTPS